MASEGADLDIQLYLILVAAEGWWMMSGDVLRPPDPIEGGQVFS